MKQDQKEGNYTKNIQPGYSVGVIQKEDQPTGKITCGDVKEILTGSSFHPYGIKVRLVAGQVGRVCEIYSGPGPARFSSGMG